MKNRTKPKKRMTNVEFITDLMNWNGPLVQVFVIDTLTNQAEKVAKMDPAKFKANAIISPQAWVEAAKIIKAKLDENYSHD